MASMGPAASSPHATIVRAGATDLTPQTHIHQPREAMLWDALRSACSTKPQDLQAKTACDGRLRVSNATRWGFLSRARSRMPPRSSRAIPRPVR